MKDFVIEASRAEKLRHDSGLGVEQFLASLVQPTADMARPPISKFHVGAVGLGYSGRIFRGVNLEFEGLPLNYTVHAEQFLVANALQHGEKRIVFIAVSAAPCGHCRQFLQELREAGNIRVLVTDGKDAQAHPLSYFLPHRFGPEDLLDKDFPLLLEPRSNCLASLQSSSLVDEGPCSTCHIGETNGKKAKTNHDDNRATNGLEVEEGDSTPAITSTAEQRPTSHEPSLEKEASLKMWVNPNQIPISELERSAFAAANASYAPYSQCPSGVAIATKRGYIYSGSYMESAAYNPGLPALQAAIVAFVCGGGGSYDEIETAALVETIGAPVQHAATARVALKYIAPKACLHVYEVAKRNL